MTTFATDPPAFESRRPGIVQFGPFRFDPGERVLSREGEEVRLPPRVTGVLAVLLERQGKVVTKQELIESVWSGAFVTETSLTEAISVLRQALGDEAQDPTYLQTVHRRGYRFIAPVQPVLIPTHAASPSHPLAAVADVPPAANGRRLAGAILIAVAAAAALAALVIASRRERPKPVHVTLSPPPGLSITPSLAISPDGRDVVFGARGDDGSRLFHRSLHDFEAKPIAGTANAFAPFFSPDGEWVGFFTGTTVSKVPIAGGAPIVICKTNGGSGGTWTRDGWIIFGADTGGLRRVRASGGEPEVLTTPDAMAGEVEHGSPQILPDGKSLLFTVVATTIHTAKLALLSLDSGEKRILLEGAAGARYIAPGVVAYATHDAVRLARFDIERGAVGEPFGTIPGVLTHPLYPTMEFHVSDEGTAVFFSGRRETPENELLRRDAAGTVTPYPTPKRYYRNIELAPDGKRAAVTILENDRSDVWVADLQNGTLSRLTFDGFNIEPVWSPDGEWVYYASNRDGPYNIYRRRADGRGPAERLREKRTHEYPLFWSPDGTRLVISQVGASTSFDIAVLERDAAGGWSHRPFVTGPGADVWAEVSPDGKWIAYTSTEGTEWNIYVQDFPAGRGKWQMSTTGGWLGSWSVDGKLLHYTSGRGVVSVPLEFVDGGIRRGPEQVISDEAIDVAHRGSVPGELVMIRESKPHLAADEIRMIIGWRESIEDRYPSF